MLPELTTGRLHLAPVGDDDLPFMYALNADPEVMRAVTGRPVDRAATDDEWSQRLNDRSDPARGLGYWVGRVDGERVGWWGLGACSWDRSTGNLGYRLSTPWWGIGLATEGARALLAHGFEDAALSSVWASTTRENGASQRVLLRLGMRYVGVRFDQSQYELHRRDWAGGLPVGSL